MTGLRLGARLWWGAVPMALLLWGTGSVLAAALPGLPQPGALTLVATPVLTFARDVALALAAGAAVLGLLADSPRARRWGLGWGAAGLGLVALTLPALRADIAAGASDVSIADVITDSTAGRALAVQAAVLLLGLILLAAARVRWARILAAVAMVAAVAIPPLGGHAGLSSDHAAAGVAIGLHVAAASVWAGGLAVTCALVLSDRSTAAVLLPRFSTLALVCVIVTAEAGLLSASLITDSPLDLLGTAYGSIIIAKAGLLAWLVWLGWQQRRRALDRLPDASVPALVGAIAGIELVIMGLAIGSAVVLTRIGPSPVPGSGFAPLTLVVLGLGIPMLVVAIRPRGWHVTDGLPEVAAVLLLIAIVEVGGVGLLSRTLGSIGMLIEAVLLVGAGWLAASAARVRVGGLIVLAIGLPVALPVAAALSDRPGVMRMSVVAAVAAEALIVVWWLRGRRPAATAAEPVAAVAG